MSTGLSQLSILPCHRLWNFLTCPVSEAHDHIDRSHTNYCTPSYYGHCLIDNWYTWLCQVGDFNLWLSDNPCSLALMMVTTSSVTHTSDCVRLETLISDPRQSLCTYLDDGHYFFDNSHTWLCWVGYFNPWMSDHPGSPACRIWQSVYILWHLDCWD